MAYFVGIVLSLDREPISKADSKAMLDFDPNGPAPADSGLFGLPYSPEDSKLVLVPVPWEATTSYGDGTSGGPSAILKASHQVDLFDLECENAYEAGIAMVEPAQDIRRWNRIARSHATKIITKVGAKSGSRQLRKAMEHVNQLGERVNEWVREISGYWLRRGRLIGILGGDHSVPFGAIQALAERHERFGILQLDAHSDTRRAYEGFRWSHASIMDNVLQHVPQVVKLVQIGIRDFCQEEVERTRSLGDRVKVFFDADIKRALFEGISFREMVVQIVRELPQTVYLSFDIDGLDPSLCPHTGTPVPGGFSYSETAFLLGELVRSGRKIIGFDLCEVSPGPEGDEWDANVGARLLYKMCVWTLLSQAGQ